MVLIGKSLDERRAAQVERRVACAAAALAGRASSASPVPPMPMSSLPSAGLSLTPTAVASGTARANETLLTPTADRTDEIFFNAATLSDITAVATPANRLAPASTSAMVTNTDSAGGGSGSGSARTLTLPGPKIITGPAYRPIHEALASQLLVNRAHVVVGQNRKNGWLNFYNKTLGITPSHQPAVMAAYKPYANDKPQAKFEKFVLAGIAYDNKEHSHKVLIGAPVDQLEECAHQVAQEIQESARVSVEESLAAAERAAKLLVNNETSEFVMGLRPSAPVEPGQEEGLDISAINLTDNTNPAFALGPRPSFRSGNCRHV